MPHLTLEYSGNLDARIDVDGLCRAAAEAILGTGLFELGAIRVRAVRCDAYVVADRVPENAFIDMVFRIGEGRVSDDKSRAGEAVFSAVQAYLPQLFGTPHFALSLELREIDAALSWKRNAIHPRLRGK